MPFPKRTVWVLLLAVVVGGTAAVKTAPWTTPARSIRGGALGPKKHSHGAAADETETTAATAATTAGSSVTVEEYAAAMRKKDARDRRGRDEGKKRDLPDDVDETEAPEGTKNDNDTNKDKDKDSTTPDATTGKDQEASTVGVKSHNAKKSNAVGDPDGVGSDDDSDEDDEASTDDWEDFEEEMEEIDILSNAAATTTTQEVQVELELLEQDLQVDEDDDSVSETTSPSGGGGVGLRLSQRLGRRKNRTKEWRSSSATAATNDRDTKTVTAAAAVTIGPAELLEAWSPYVYLPPTGAAMEYLMEHARHLDGASKSRLDRRTLYAGLLMEWRHARTYRKFLPAATSQALQAALSLATQPVWRRSFPRPSGIRLYEDHEAAARGCTLAMQETIAMALAHSLGAGMVILDDAILSTIRQSLLRNGHAEEDVKPAILIQSLLNMARQGKLRGGTGGLISKCMQKELSQGLDDPYDERATASCQDMVVWEEKSQAAEEKSREEDLPLVIFVRAQASTSLLKSKSVVEVLMQECSVHSKSEGINLVILGKGIDAKTVSLPKESSQEAHEPQEVQASNLPGAAPWFGFSPHNQNASGQNDPDGSRRFNIFLARTVDPSGTAGILGAIAPPQAGNLFPHMMAMQARDRLQEHDDDSPVKAELERWAQLLQQQMQTNGGQPLPPPQFFNASLSSPPSFGGDEAPTLPPANQQLPPPEVIQQTLQQAMTELLDRLSKMNDDGEGSPELSPDLHKAFAQILRNENLRQGIAENLARAAPALSDPKCQGVMLSVYVPPPPSHMNGGKLPGAPNGRMQSNNMSGWFQKILNNQEEAEKNIENDDGRRKDSKQKRVRTMAAAAAVMAAKNAQDVKDNEKQENKADRNLAKLESLCRPIVVTKPADPVRAKAWEGWIGRERGSVTFRQNRRALNEQLEGHFLSLQEHTGTRGAGSSLRQMLSVKIVTGEMGDVMKCAIELEAAKSQRQHESPDESHNKEMDLDVDTTLSQLLLTEDGLVENTDDVASSSTRVSADAKGKTKPPPGLQYLHPSTLEAALSRVCRISPSPSGGVSLSNAPAASHRTKEEITALAQDKHERALVSQVVSPQDIGVTYDMIGGLTEVKELLRQSVTYPLKFPHLYSEGIAREAVKGVLLFGPPGTGKTMLAKAVATEGGASFLSVDASSVENKWLGESEKNAKAVFTLARRLAPCVIFIDEVDSLLSSREGSSDDSAHGTLTSVKTTMMSEWDGLNSGTNGAGEAGSDRVVVIGSTNRPFDLDEAVLRRFPRRILVDLPDLETRREILEVTLAENRLDQGVNLTTIADRLEGYTGSDIKEVCREAVVQISHEQAKLLDQGFGNSREDVTQGSLQRLRPVTSDDFESALNKLKRSVSEKGRELARVWEWNDEYGEIKKEKKNHLPHLASMYL